MKLSSNTDFTALPRAEKVLTHSHAEPYAIATLAHDERHLRRRVVFLKNGERVLVDLPEPVALVDGDRLVMEDGREIEIRAAPEEVFDIRARGPKHFAELCWHIGNRHLAAQIDDGRILILRDHVIKAMLEGLGATVTDVLEPFVPVRGAYAGGHGHDHGHHGHGHHGHDHHDHDHSHGERDAYGRLPGDPHYGHNHG